MRARKGVFITTSDFSAGAKDAALGLDIKVVLIDSDYFPRSDYGCAAMTTAT